MTAHVERGGHTLAENITHLGTNKQGISLIFCLLVEKHCFHIT